MCLECDGWTDDEIYDHYDELIATYGWMVQHIGGGAIDEPPWSYTIGLSAGFDHPELVVVGLSPERAIGILNDLSRRVANGGLFVPGSLAENAAGTLEVVFAEVHPLQWETPVFTMWRHYYGSRGRAPDQRALQVVLPVEMVGPRARRWQPCLDDPDVVIGGDPDRPRRHPRHQHRRSARRRR